MLLPALEAEEFLAQCIFVVDGVPQ